MTQSLGIVPPQAGAYIHRAARNSYYRRAVEAQPGYLTAVALRDKAMQRRQATQFPQVQYPEPPTSIDADLDAYLGAFTTARAEEDERARQIDALTNVIGACERAINGATGDTDALLHSLAADFGDWLTRAKRGDAKLKGASTAMEAIDLDVAGPWRDLTPLRSEYDQLRAAQELVLSGAYIDVSQYRSDHVDNHTPQPDPLASDTHLADLDDVFPTWRERDTRFYMQGSPPDRRPWPQDPLEQLVWIIRHATPWIPTTRQLDDLHRDRAHRIDPTPEADLTDMVITPNQPTDARNRVVQRVH
jgi:hypothetical protein